MQQAIVISDLAEWDAIRSEWDELYAASPTSSPALDYFWLRTWWELYEPALRDPQLRIVTVRRSDRLVGALPLYVQRESGRPLGIRRLWLISTGEPEDPLISPEYLNMLHLPGEDGACADAIWRALRRSGWDHANLVDLAEDTPLLLSTEAPSRIRESARESCPIADLNGGFEEYLQRLSSNGRQNARRLMRQGEQAGARLEIVQADQLEDAYQDLIRLHQARWTAAGHRGVFSSPTFTEFHRRLIREWLPSGKAVLARLWLASEVAAVLYGFVARHKFDYYQAGMLMDTGGRLSSPGILAHLLLMQALSERGVTTYDFLKGDYSFKERLSTRANHLVTIKIRRLTLRSAVDSLARRTVRFIRKATRR